MVMSDVAIYNDTSYPYRGAWTDGDTSIKAMLDYGYTYVDIPPSQMTALIDPLSGEAEQRVLFASATQLLPARLSATVMGRR